MEMMNAIGYLSELDRVSAEIVRSGCVHIVNALSEIDQNDFTLLTPEQNTNALMNLNFIRQYNKPVDNSNIIWKAEELMDIFDLRKDIRKTDIVENFEFGSIARDIEAVYKEVFDRRSLEVEMDGEIKKLYELQENVKHIKNINVDLNMLRNMNFFTFKMGRFSKANYLKLKDNIENISSIIYELSTVQGYQIVIFLTPKILETEVDRIFKSLNFEEISIPSSLNGNTESIIEELDNEISKKSDELKSLHIELANLKEKYSSLVEESYSRLNLYEKVLQINSDVACTGDFFYMAGWVPVSKKKNLENKLAGFGDKLILIFKPQSEISSIKPPTKLKNNRFVKPFEILVGMYGIPSYNEMDPTSFVAVSYMIMFGCMFGDIGQGFVFLLAGIMMSLKNRESDFGGILSRLGISSMIFGALFGSVFGNEDIFPHLLIKPLDNINAMLIGGVVLGVAFTTIGFIYSLINAFKRKDLEDGVFGKNGLVGLVFYWIVLLTALSVFEKYNMIVSLNTIIAALCLLLALMVFKQPIANAITGRRPLYSESVSDYYIESGFGIVETLLSMLSNTISFIRVGAFALNHVGLFLAFATISKLMKSSAGSVAVLVLGNVIVICLEGLIVFIQGLRLEYYELFSKYYEGSGVEYIPAKLIYSNKSVKTQKEKNIVEKQVQPAANI
jgi:Archaeal/vacuolar-type H+-ATPase subunit I